MTASTIVVHHQIGEEGEDIQDPQGEKVLGFPLTGSKALVAHPLDNQVLKESIMGNLAHLTPFKPEAHGHSWETDLPLMEDLKGLIRATTQEPRGLGLALQWDLDWALLEVHTQVPIIRHQIISLALRHLEARLTKGFVLMVHHPREEDGVASIGVAVAEGEGKALRHS